MEKKINIYDIPLYKEKIRFLKNFDIHVSYDIFTHTQSNSIDMFGLNYWDGFKDKYGKDIWENLEEYNSNVLRRVFDILYMSYIKNFININDWHKIDSIFRRFITNADAALKILVQTHEHIDNVADCIKTLQNIKNITDLNEFFEKKLQKSYIF